MAMIDERQAGCASAAAVVRRSCAATYAEHALASAHHSQPAARFKAAEKVAHLCFKRVVGGVGSRGQAH